MADTKTVTVDALIEFLKHTRANHENSIAARDPVIAAHIKDLGDWIDALAAPTPAAQGAGQEAVAHIVTRKDDGERFLVFADKMTSWRKYPDDFDVSDLYAAPVNGGERACTCHADDRPNECQHRYAASECQRAADAPQVGGDEHANRYRVEKASGGFWPNAVRCGTGTRELFVGHKKQCERVAAELKTAFEDGRFVERTAALTSPAKEQK